MSSSRSGAPSHSPHHEPPPALPTQSTRLSQQPQPARHSPQQRQSFHQYHPGAGNVESSAVNVHPGNPAALFHEPRLNDAVSVDGVPAAFASSTLPLGAAPRGNLASFPVAHQANTAGAVTGQPSFTGVDERASTLANHVTTSAQSNALPVGSAGHGYGVQQTDRSIDQAQPAAFPAGPSTAALPLGIPRHADAPETQRSLDQPSSAPGQLQPETMTNQHQAPLGDSDILSELSSFVGASNAGAAPSSQALPELQSRQQHLQYQGEALPPQPPSSHHLQVQQPQLQRQTAPAGNIAATIQQHPQSQHPRGPGDAQNLAGADLHGLNVGESHLLQAQHAGLVGNASESPLDRASVDMIPGIMQQHAQAGTGAGNLSGNQVSGMSPGDAVVDFGIPRGQAAQGFQELQQQHREHQLLLQQQTQGAAMQRSQRKQADIPPQLQQRQQHGAALSRLTPQQQNPATALAPEPGTARSSAVPQGGSHSAALLQAQQALLNQQSKARVQGMPSHPRQARPSPNASAGFPQSFAQTTASFGNALDGVRQGSSQDQQPGRPSGLDMGMVPPQRSATSDAKTASGPFVGSGALPSSDMSNPLFQVQGFGAGAMPVPGQRAGFVNSEGSGIGGGDATSRATLGQSQPSMARMVTPDRAALRAHAERTSGKKQRPGQITNRALLADGQITNAAAVGGQHHPPGRQASMGLGPSAQTASSPPFRAQSSTVPVGSHLDPQALARAQAATRARAMSAPGQMMSQQQLQQMASARQAMQATAASSSAASSMPPGRTAKRARANPLQGLSPAELQAQMSLIKRQQLQQQQQQQQMRQQQMHRNNQAATLANMPGQVQNTQDILRQIGAGAGLGVPPLGAGAPLAQQAMQAQALQQAALQIRQREQHQQLLQQTGLAGLVNSGAQIKDGSRVPLAGSGTVAPGNQAASSLQALEQSLGPGAQGPGARPAAMPPGFASSMQAQRQQFSINANQPVDASLHHPGQLPPGVGSSKPGPVDGRSPQQGALSLGVGSMVGVGVPPQMGTRPDIRGPSKGTSSQDHSLSAGGSSGSSQQLRPTGSSSATSRPTSRHSQSRSKPRPSRAKASRQAKTVGTMTSTGARTRAPGTLQQVDSYGLGMNSQGVQGAVQGLVPAPHMAQRPSFLQAPPPQPPSLQHQHLQRAPGLTRAQEAQRAAELQHRLLEQRKAAEAAELARKKRARLDNAPTEDQKKVLVPDYQTPFYSKIDAWQRLLPFHCLYLPESETNSEEWNAKVGELTKIYAKSARRLIDSSVDTEHKFAEGHSSLVPKADRNTSDAKDTAADVTKKSQSESGDEKITKPHRSSGADGGAQAPQSQESASAEADTNCETRTVAKGADSESRPSLGSAVEDITARVTAALGKETCLSLTEDLHVEVLLLEDATEIHAQRTANLLSSFGANVPGNTGLESGMSSSSALGVLPQQPSSVAVDVASSGLGTPGIPQSGAPQVLARVDNRAVTGTPPSASPSPAPGHRRTATTDFPQSKPLRANSPGSAGKTDRKPRYVSPKPGQGLPDANKPRNGPMPPSASQTNSAALTPSRSPSLSQSRMSVSPVDNRVDAFTPVGSSGAQFQELGPAVASTPSMPALTTPLRVPSTGHANGTRGEHVSNPVGHMREVNTEASSLANASKPQGSGKAPEFAARTVASPALQPSMQQMSPKVLSAEPNISGPTAGLPTVLKQGHPHAADVAMATPGEGSLNFSAFASLQKLQHGNDARVGGQPTSDTGAGDPAVGASAMSALNAGNILGQQTRSLSGGLENFPTQNGALPAPVGDAGTDTFAVSPPPDGFRDVSG